MTKECLDSNALEQKDNDAETVLLQHDSSKNQRYNNDMNVLRQRLPNTSRLNNMLNTDMDIELTNANEKKEIEVSTSLNAISLENESLTNKKKIDKGLKI